MDFLWSGDGERGIHQVSRNVCWIIQEWQFRFQNLEALRKIVLAIDIARVVYQPNSTWT